MLSSSPEQMSQGTGDWKNIQPVVRSTFYEMHAVIEQQAAAIKRLEAQVSALQRQDEARTAASRAAAEKLSALEASLAEVAQASSGIHSNVAADVSGRLEQHLATVRILLNAKADRDSLDEACASLRAKADATDLQRLSEEVERQGTATAAALSGVVSVAERAEAAAQSLAPLEGLRPLEALIPLARAPESTDLCERLSSCVSRDDLRRELGAASEELQEKASQGLERLRSDCEAAYAKLSSLQKVSEAQEAVRRAVDELGAEAATTAKALEALGQQTEAVDKLRLSSDQAAREAAGAAAGLAELREIVAAQPKEHEEAVAAHLKREVFPHMAQLIKYEVSTSNTEILGDVEERLSSLQENLARVIARTVQSETEKSAAEVERHYRSSVEQTASRLEQYRSETVEALNREIEKVEDYLEKVAETVENNQTALAARLRVYDEVLGSSDAISAVPTARWVWKGRRLTQAGAILWSQEICNTQSSNFLWEKGKSSVYVCTAGCYRVDFVVFGRRRLTVQLHVNGEPLVSAMSGDVAPYMYLRPKGEAVNCYSGQTLMDYVYLGDNSTVQVVVVGDSEKWVVSGFLQLQRVW